MIGRLGGSMTLHIMTFIITQLFIMALIILSISMLNFIMLSVTNKSIIVNDVMLSAFSPVKVNYIFFVGVDKVSS